MPHVHTGVLKIEFDTFGRDSDQALLLIMGMGGQMILWESDLCESLAARGLFVIRFDNRDVGLSSKVPSPYTLEEMAGDAVGLLDALGIDRAHVCGASMGGMIAQIMAIQHPARVLSLISIASATGNPGLSLSGEQVIDPVSIQVEPMPTEREANIEHTVRGMRELSGPGFGFDEERARAVAAEAFDRCFYPEGAERHLDAILRAPDRRPALEALTVPTLVIHGDSDPLVPLEAGEDTARAIPGATLLVIEGMGHDLPRGAWPRIVDAIAAHVMSADS